MNGAITEPCARINNPPNTNMTMIIGKSHSFFLILRNVQNSFINSNIIQYQNCFLKLICDKQFERYLQ